MPDIFGRNPEDYAVVRQMNEDGIWERYQAENAARRPNAEPQHNFEALGQGAPQGYERAAENAQAIGYLTNSQLAIQTMVDEIMYTAFRLPDFVDLDMSVPEGASSWGPVVRDRTGRAIRVTAPGTDVPRASVARAIVPKDVHYYGLDAAWSVDEIRGAMMSGTPLDTESIEAAVMGSLETMEAVGLTGGDYSADDPGLLNLPTTGDDAVDVQTQGGNMTFADLTGNQIRTLINGDISWVIEKSRETLSRNINTGMTVYLPGAQYDMLTSKYVGNDARQTVMAALLADNSWTHRTGNPLMIESVVELDSALNPGSTTDQMVVGVKHNRVACMGVAYMPRVLTILDQGREIVAQVESKYTPLFPKRPTTMRYRRAI